MYLYVYIQPLGWMKYNLKPILMSLYVYIGHFLLLTFPCAVYQNHNNYVYVGLYALIYPSLPFRLPSQSVPSYIVSGGVHKARWPRKRLRWSYRLVTSRRNRHKSSKRLKTWVLGGMVIHFYTCAVYTYMYCIKNSIAITNNFQWMCFRVYLNTKVTWTC